MNKILLPFIFIIIFSLGLVCAETHLEVYRDGYVGVEIVTSMDELQMSEEIILISSEVDNIYVTDKDGGPIYYELQGDRLILYSIGEEELHLTYFVSDLTSKDGITWSLSFESHDNTIVSLPDHSSILYIDPLPEEIDLEKNELTFLPGSEVSIEYFIGLEEEEGHYLRPVISVFILLFISVVCYKAYRYSKRPKKAWKDDGDLDAIERRVLDLLFENGEMMESEIRERVPLPKTSSWRMMKRLSEQGYIAIEKKNKINFIRLNKRS